MIHVDAGRAGEWCSRTPFYKWIVALVIDLSLWPIAATVNLLIHVLARFDDLLVNTSVSVGRWSGFIPIAICECELNGHIVFYRNPVGGCTVHGATLSGVPSPPYEGLPPPEDPR